MAELAQLAAAAQQGDEAKEVVLTNEHVSGPGMWRFGSPFRSLPLPRCVTILQSDLGG